MTRRQPQGRGSRRSRTSRPSTRSSSIVADRGADRRLIAAKMTALLGAAGPSSRRQRRGHAEGDPRGARPLKIAMAGTHAADPVRTCRRARSGAAHRSPHEGQSMDNALPKRPMDRRPRRSRRDRVRSLRQRVADGAAVLAGVAIVAILVLVCVEVGAAPVQVSLLVVDEICGYLNAARRLPWPRLDAARGRLHPRRAPLRPRQGRPEAGACAG